MFIKRLNIIFLPTYCTRTRARTHAQRARKRSRQESAQIKTSLTLQKRYTLTLYIPRVVVIASRFHDEE